MSAEKQSRGPILFLGCVPFRSLRQRPQQLALELSLRGRVVYVDPPRSPVGRLVAPDRSVEAAPASGGAFSVVAPGTGLPGSGYFSILNRYNYSRFARSLRRRLEEHGAGSPRAIIASFPKQIDLLRAFPGTWVCYDVMDDYPLFFDRWQGAVLGRLHRELLGRADLVTVTSSRLEELCRPFARRLARVPNAVDAPFHDACAVVAPDPYLRSLPAPRIGYVGALERWVDFELIRTLASTFSGGSVILVGPRGREDPALPANVHLLGERPHASLPGVLRAFQVGIVPFIRSPLTEAVNAVKVYEYLSAGLPVVATALEGVSEFGDLVTPCSSSREWVDGVRQAVPSSREGEVIRRREFAARNLWSARADTLVRLLEEAEAIRG